MKSVLITLLLSSTFAAAAPQISPQRIIVNPIETSLKSKVWLDRTADSSGYATYRPGDNVTIKASVNEDAYLYLFSVDPKGEIVQIFPNQYAEDNFVEGGQTVTLPGPDANYTFEVDKDPGISKVFAVAAKDPLDFQDVVEIKNNAVFATYHRDGQEAFAQEISGILNSIPDDAWHSSVILYRTQPEVKSGELTVKTNVQDAKVYLDGKLVGESGSPIENLAPGKYQVKVVAQGYTTYSTSLTINADRSVSLTVNLKKAQPVNTKANLYLRLNVSKASIYMNGQKLGATSNGRYNLVLTKNKQYKVSVVATGYTSFAAYVKLTGDKTMYITLKKR